MKTGSNPDDFIARVRARGVEVTERAVPIGETFFRPDVSEKDFMAAAIALAKRNGWIAFHTHDARRSEKGFPDLFLLRNNRALAIELKVHPKKPKPEQLFWVAAMNAAGIVALVAYPEDWPKIVQLLK